MRRLGSSAISHSLQRRVRLTVVDNEKYCTRRSLKSSKKAQKSCQLKCSSVVSIQQSWNRQYNVEITLHAVHGVQQRQRTRGNSRLIANRREDSLALTWMYGQHNMRKRRLQSEPHSAPRMKGSTMVEDPRGRQQPRVASVVKPD